MKKTVFKLLLLIFSAKNLLAQPQLVWEKKYGGSNFEYGPSGIQTADGQLAFVLSSKSSNGDVPSNVGRADLWVVKMDTAGTILWSKNFGGSDSEEPGGIAETPTGDFWVFGTTHSNDSIFSKNKGGTDVVLLKISNLGDLIFAKTFGGSSTEKFEDFEQTADGGLIFVASTWSESNSGDVLFNHGERDCWLVKLNEFGEIEWQKSFGGSNREKQSNIQKSKKGGFWISVVSKSSDGDFNQISGDDNTWVLRLDENGSILWKNRIAEKIGFVQPTIEEDSEGNLLLMTSFESDWRNYLIKFDQNGTKILETPLPHPYPFPKTNFLSFKIASNDGFYLFGSDSLNNAYLVKTNDFLDIIWEKSFTAESYQPIWQVLESPALSLLVIASIYPVGSQSNPNADTKLWLLKLKNTVSVNDVNGITTFNISPNPISDGEPLQIFWGNENFKLLKIEILSLDGRVLQVFEKEKTAEKQVFQIENLPAETSFFVRVSDEKRTATRLVLKF